MKFFISYRRKDVGGHAKALHDELKKRFPSADVFYDKESRADSYGRDLLDYLAECLEETDIVLALVGPDWVGVESERGLRSIDNENDPVRFELAVALASAGIRVIPLLLEGAEALPDEELPESLQGLFNKVGPIEKLRTTDFAHDAGRFLDHLRSTLRSASPLNQQACVAVGGGLRWLRPEANTRVLLARPQGDGDGSSGASVALSADAIVAAQIVANSITLWALNDPVSGSYSRWRSEVLPEDWLRPVVLAVRREGPTIVEVAISFEEAPTHLSKVARLAFGVESCEDPSSVRGEAVCGAFLGSSLLYVDTSATQTMEWQSPDADPEEWLSLGGGGHLWLDAAVVDGDVLVAVLAKDPGGDRETTAVIMVHNSPGRGEDLLAGPGSARQLVVPRRLDLNGGPRIVVRTSSGWRELHDGSSGRPEVEDG